MPKPSSITLLKAVAHWGNTNNLDQNVDVPKIGQKFTFYEFFHVHYSQKSERSELSKLALEFVFASDLSDFCSELTFKLELKSRFFT